MIAWPLPPDAGVGTARRLFDILFDQAYGSLEVTWVLGDVDAAAIWLPPAEAARFAEIEMPTRAAMAALTDDGGARYGTFWDWLGSHLPERDCWFLDVVAVAEERRGTGLGKRLVRHGLARAHEAGQAAFLETARPENVPMYEHLGFRVAEQAAAPDGGPTIWFMLADPP